jgi:CBS domain-containing protein
VHAIAPQSQVCKVMSKPAKCVHSSEGVFDATQSMMDYAVRRLPVVDDDGELVGLVTLDDLLRVLSRELSNLSQSIKSEMEVR